MTWFNELTEIQKVFACLGIVAAVYAVPAMIGTFCSIVFVKSESVASNCVYAWMLWPFTLLVIILAGPFVFVMWVAGGIRVRREDRAKERRA